MTQREVAALVCRAMAVYAFLMALNVLPLMLTPLLTSMMESTASRFAPVLNILPALLHVLAGLLLWFGADKVAARMTKDGDERIEVMPSEAGQTIVFSALGIFSLLLAVPRLGQVATNHIISSSQELVVAQNWTLPQVVAALIQLALGLWLLFGAAGLVKLLKSFRTIGMDDEALPATRNA